MAFFTAFIVNKKTKQVFFFFFFVISGIILFLDLVTFAVLYMKWHYQGCLLKRR